jgi:hypothetical protein
MYGFVGLQNARARRRRTNGYCLFVQRVFVCLYYYYYFLNIYYTIYLQISYNTLAHTVTLNKRISPFLVQFSVYLHAPSIISKCTFF